MENLTKVVTCNITGEGTLKNGKTGQILKKLDIPDKEVYLVFFTEKIIKILPAQYLKQFEEVV